MKTREHMGKIIKIIKISMTILFIFLFLAGLQRLLMPKYMGDVREGGMIEEYYAE